VLLAVISLYGGMKQWTLTTMAGIAAVGLAVELLNGTRFLANHSALYAYSLTGADHALAMTMFAASTLALVFIPYCIGRGVRKLLDRRANPAS
jgi:hypothetical protein